MKEILEQINSLSKRVAEAVKIVGLEKLKNELKDLEKKMQASDFWTNHMQAAKISRQAAEAKKEIEIWENMNKEIFDLVSLVDDSSVQKTDLAKEIQDQVAVLEKKFEKMELGLLMSGKHDQAGAVVSIHAGAGGDDAQDWAEMLSRMYLCWAENNGYKTEILDSARGSSAGIKSITMNISGVRVYGQLKSEYGVHRLVRLSPFDADHARHTSFALVEVLPELDEVGDFDLDETDLRIDTYRSQGAGGQHVNTTDSAVRIVHLPTKITVTCQNERSQAANKETAMKILQAKLQYLLEEERVDEIKKLKGDHKQAAWGNQIRSYVLHPYKMVKDLRTEYEESNPDKVLDGEIDRFIESFLRFQAKK